MQVFYYICPKYPRMEAIIQKIKTYLKSQPVNKAWIFGSFARGEDNDSSDIDILVDFDNDNYPSLLKHAGMINDLEDILHLKVDLVPHDCIYPSFRSNIERDRILVYERR